MKKFLLLSALAILSIAASNAQTVTTIKYKTIYGKLIDYGYMATRTTVDSAVDVLDSIVITADEAGVIEVQMVGFNDSLGIAVTGSKLIAYRKHGGTLSLGSATNSLATVTDSGLGTATWTISASGNNILVTIKGKLTYTVLWRAYVRRTYQKGS